MNHPIDILVLSNGPGELATWVKPVVQALRRRLGEDRSQVRISVVLSPCANASGQEAAIARRYPEVDRVQAAEQFFPFLLWGKTQENWDWRNHGVVLFLGGDQFFPIVIGKRLNYRTVVYAEWEARWHRWIDRFGVMRAEVGHRVPPSYRHKLTVVGDLMAEAGSASRNAEGRRYSGEQPPLCLGVLPGSKPVKLFPGLPLMLAIAERVQQVQPTLRVGIAVAPTLQLAELAAYADPSYNPAIQRFGWAAATLVSEGSNGPYLKTASGLQVELWTEFPAYDRLSECDLCLTTLGANTAELGALAIPMLVLLPTQQMELMRAWDGVPGLLANLPGIGGTVAKVLSKLALRRVGRLAWPNIWAGAEIVPELAGLLQPEAVAQQVLEFLNHPGQLNEMRAQLRSVRGQPGAAEKLAQLVYEELEKATAKVGE